MNARVLAAPPPGGRRAPGKELAELARLRPTPHNTQPFRIRPLNARVAQLVMLRERMLPVEDTDNLYVLASFGIFAETLERAGLDLGLDPAISPAEALEPAA